MENDVNNGSDSKDSYKDMKLTLSASASAIVSGLERLCSTPEFIEEFVVSKYMGLVEDCNVRMFLLYNDVELEHEKPDIKVITPLEVKVLTYLNTLHDAHGDDCDHTLNDIIMMDPDKMDKHNFEFLSLFTSDFQSTNIKDGDIFRFLRKFSFESQCSSIGDNPYVCVEKAALKAIVNSAKCLKKIDENYGDEIDYNYNIPDGENEISL